MSLLSTPGFCKKKACPSASTLLLHTQATLADCADKYVAAHLAHCDFCGAEVQLLTKHSAHQHSPSGVECVCAPLPLHLRLLAERLLTIDSVLLDDLPGIDFRDFDEARTT